VANEYVERAAWWIADAKIPIVSNWVEQKLMGWAAYEEAENLYAQEQREEAEAYADQPWPDTMGPTQAELEVRDEQREREEQRKQRPVWEEHYKGPFAERPEDLPSIGDARLGEAPLMVRTDDERDFRFSQYFRTPDGEDIRIASYRTDDGYYFRIENDSDETAIVSGGPFTSAEAAASIGNQLLFEELNGERKQEHEHGSLEVTDSERDEDQELGH
jgi:hypothetical protein